MADRRYTINACTINLQLTSDASIGINEKITDTSLTGNPSGRVTLGSTTPLLSLLSQEDVKATFFVARGLQSQLQSGWKELLHDIAAQGHELGLLISPPHSTTLSTLRETIAREKYLLESFLGRNIAGCRILPLSGHGSRLQAEYEVLSEKGFVYSSSVYPPRDLRIGIQNSRRRAWGVRLANGILWELPATAWCPFGIGFASVRSAHPEHYPTWTIARSIEGMNKHGEPALISLNSTFNQSLRELQITTGAAERLQRIFKAYRFGTTFDAFASRLTLGFEDSTRPTHRRTGIIRCDARTAAPLL